MLAHQDRVRIFGYRVPQYGWFVVSGFLCDVVQFFIDWAISLIYFFNWEKATVCWTLSYVISIVVRHFSHRLIVFGDYEGTYWTSLAKTYATYSSSIVLSILTNYALVRYLYLSHTNAWLATLIWTGIYNYFMLKASWNRDRHTGAGEYTEVSTVEV